MLRSHRAPRRALDRSIAGLAFPRSRREIGCDIDRVGEPGEVDEPPPVESRDRRARSTRPAGGAGSPRSRPCSGSACCSPRWSPPYARCRSSSPSVSRSCSARRSPSCRGTAGRPVLVGTRVRLLLIFALLYLGPAEPASGYGPLVFVPVLWLALYHGPRLLSAGLAAAGLVLFLPLAVRPAGAGSGGWRPAALWLGAAPWSPGPPTGGCCAPPPRGPRPAASATSPPPSSTRPASS